MSNLPSPRTRRQAQMDILINAMHLMSEEEFDRVYREIGPYCMEKLLDATAPAARAATHPQPDAPPSARKREPTVKRVDEARTKAALEAVAAAGLSVADLKALGIPEKAARSYVERPDGSKAMFESHAKAIEEFMK